ncbi:MULTISPECIES: hypothetical protein [Halomonadaceae]|uniref:Uncharacterized protein n=1 Tax=Vreelandella halophila TaxID=86177 RepID=A0A9X5B5D1_9GAMM|nr:MULTISPECIES: hypothetical protein [Halomonas]MYL26037.1 hypothetical protein [Halomonas utahensis]MYL73401.1 hypothetical protein [Halomonas sp. 22501_18_FS]
MNIHDERVEDVIENCNILLDKLSHYSQTDSTPEGRMISQLKWLKERAEAGSLDLPVDRRYIATLAYVFTEGSLRWLATSREEYVWTVEVYEKRLLSLTKHGSFLAKREYYPYVARCVDKLIGILRNASRPLSAEEKGCIRELNVLGDKLTREEIEPPLMIGNDYTNFREVYAPWECTIEDLPEGKAVSRVVSNFVFNGRRPQSWVTTEAADQETNF